MGGVSAGAAPVRTGDRCGLSWVVPSGKIATVMPRWSSCTTVAKVPALSPPPSAVRWTGSTPTAASSAWGPPASSTAWPWRWRGSRPSAPARTTGSTNPLKWLATMRRGPLGRSSRTDDLDQQYRPRVIVRDERHEAVEPASHQASDRPVGLTQAGTRRWGPVREGLGIGGEVHVGEVEVVRAGRRHRRTHRRRAARRPPPPAA